MEPLLPSSKPSEPSKKNSLTTSSSRRTGRFGRFISLACRPNVSGETRKSLRNFAYPPPLPLGSLSIFPINYVGPRIQPENSFTCFHVFLDDPNPCHSDAEANLRRRSTKTHTRLHGHYLPIDHHHCGLGNRNYLAKRIKWHHNWRRTLEFGLDRFRFASRTLVRRVRAQRMYLCLLAIGGTVHYRHAIQ